MLARRFRLPRRRSGFTFVELITAVALSSAVAIGLSSLLLFSARAMKGNFNQRRHMQSAKSLSLVLNQQLRPAPSNRTLVLAGGTRIDYSWPGEPDFRRRIRILPGPDGDLQTPWDNTVELDPNVSSSGDEEQIAEYVVPDGAVAFERASAIDPVRIRLRVGDPVTTDPDLKKRSDAHTGLGVQGANIDLRVMPRNTGA